MPRGIIRFANLSFFGNNTVTFALLPMRKFNKQTPVAVPAGSPKQRGGGRDDDNDPNPQNLTPRGGEARDADQ
jgi:hypothetical protein